MKPIPTEIVFLAAKRTPFGTYGGSLKDQSATDLGVHAAKAAIAQAGVKPEDIDNVVFGNVVQTSPDAIYLARHVGLKAGVPQHVPALTVNRLCGSGFQAVVDAALEMLAGHSECALVGGAESMSQAPHVARGLRFGSVSREQIVNPPHLGHRQPAALLADRLGFLAQELEAGLVVADLEDDRHQRGFGGDRSGAERGR